MKIKRILDYIQCPYCSHKKLLLKKNEKLACEKCKSLFDIVRGVPILMKSDHFGVQEKEQLKWFDKHYSRFSSKKYKLENWRLSMLKRIFETDFSKNVKTYLDIGCGATGYTTIEAAKKLGWLSFGIDISLEAILRAKALAQKQGLEKRTAFLVCSAENLPFRSGLFDYISAISLLEHLENDERVIKGVSKVVKKKGHFYICVPNTYRSMWPFLWPIYFYLDKKIGHKRHYSIEGLTKKAKKGGFELEKLFYNGHLTKLVQLVLDKLRLISEENWWWLEEKDISQNSMGIQLNAIFKRG